MKLAETPKITIGIRSEARIAASLLVISVKREIKRVLSVPKTTRLNNQTEYTADSTTPRVEKRRTVLFLEKTPKNNKSSPIKFDVPGKLIFARVKEKKKKENSGITVTRPP